MGDVEAETLADRDAGVGFVAAEAALGEAGELGRDGDAVRVDHADSEVSGTPVFPSVPSRRISAGSKS